MVRTGEEFQTASFRLSTLLMNDKFLIENNIYMLDLITDLLLLIIVGVDLNSTRMNTRPLKFANPQKSSSGYWKFRNAVIANIYWKSY